jgi:hypothetical protein
MAPSDVHVQTAGAWTESEMARTPGARADRQRQQWRRSRGPPSVAQGRCGGDGSDPRLSAGSETPASARGFCPAQSGRPKNGTGHKTPRRGCRKATRCGGRKPSIGCGVGARATRRLLRAPSRETDCACPTRFKRMDASHMPERARADWGLAKAATTRPTDATAPSAAAARRGSRRRWPPAMRSAIPHPP